MFVKMFQFGAEGQRIMSLLSSHVRRAAVAYWLERRIRDRNEDFEREFDSPLTHTLLKVRDAQ